MQKIISLKKPPRFLASAAVGGLEEGRGPLGKKFDRIDRTDRFGMKTWELAESEMTRQTVNFLFGKAQISPRDVDFLLAGDLQNQCVAGSSGLYSFGIPYLGLYGACSTLTEGLALSALLLSESDSLSLGAVAVSSHNAAAERQFRTPLEYGAQRPKTAGWTATAAGGFLLSSENGKTDKSVSITEVMFGKIIDGAISDGANMGAAMAPAAAETILRYFTESGHKLSDFDAVVTGDLGEVGSKILCRLLADRLPHFAEKHRDCGLLLYDREVQDVHAGGSGPGCSAAVLATHFLPALADGSLRSILFLSTGALMSPSSIAQGEHIFGIAPLIHMEGRM